MSLFRYVAVRLSVQPIERLEGEIAGDTAADARASLRRIGLDVLEIRPLRRRELPRLGAARDAWQEYLRGRRRRARAEFFDGLATLLDSGLPMLEGVEALSRSRRLGSSLRRMLLHLRESLRGGASLSRALSDQPDWFSGLEVAMAEAGERAGNLAQVLHDLADRQERAGRLADKVLGALAYPAGVFVLGLCVVAFLSTKTLPELVAILTQARIEAPALTIHVMTVGRFLADHGLALLVAIGAAIAALVVLRTMPIAERWVDARVVRALVPDVFRRVTVARVATTLSQLVGTGVPVLDALRVLAPTVRSLPLRRHLLGAADRVERGEPLSEAIADERFFDEEVVRLIELGQQSGDLARLLARLGERQERSAQRSLERLAAVVEPVSILLLAALVGLVALAAVLPLFRMQEVL